VSFDTQTDRFSQTPQGIDISGWRQKQVAKIVDCGELIFEFHARFRIRFDRIKQK
jgi:hypothetical protein